MRIKDWEDADRAMQSLARLDRDAEVLQAQAEQRIDTIRERLERDLRPTAKESAALEEALERFVRDREDEMIGRSRQLVFGRVWLRKTSRVTARSWKRVLDWLIAHRKSEYYRVKYEPNKETLKDASPELLKACGARIKDEDAFGYELNS